MLVYPPISVCCLQTLQHLLLVAYVDVGLLTFELQKAVCIDNSFSATGRATG